MNLIPLKILIALIASKPSAFLSKRRHIFYHSKKNACKGSDFLGNKQINQLFYTKVCVNGKKVVPLRAFTKNTTLSV